MTNPVSLVTQHFKGVLAPLATDWPVRWSNGQWPSGTMLSEGNLPLDSDGAPAPAIEAEIIAGGEELLAMGPTDDGKRTSRMSGLMRAYVSVGQGTGDDAITARVDAISNGLRRGTTQFDADTRLVLIDPRVDDNAAAYEDGDRYVRTVSVAFDLYFRAPA